MTAHDDAVKAAAEAGQGVSHDFLVECGLTDNEADAAINAVAEAAVAAAAPILLAAEQKEIEYLRGIIERVSWRTARMVGAISTEEIDPLPEDYDLEDLHARLQTQIGIERLESAREIEKLRQAQVLAERDAARAEVEWLQERVTALSMKATGIAPLRLRDRTRCPDVTKQGTRRDRTRGGAVTDYLDEIAVRIEKRRDHINDRRRLVAALRAVEALPQRPWDERRADDPESRSARAYNSALADVRTAIRDALEAR